MLGDSMYLVLWENLIQLQKNIGYASQKLVKGTRNMTETN